MGVAHQRHRIGRTGGHKLGLRQILLMAAYEHQRRKLSDALRHKRTQPLVFACFGHKRVIGTCHRHKSRVKAVFVFQFFNLAPYLTAEQNILVPVYLAGRTQKSVQDKLDSLMEFMGIAGRKKALPAKMSGGEQQRTAIARALIFEPEIIFLDEPTGNLDSMNAEEVMKLLCSVNREFGTTVVQVTHSEQNALYGKRIIRLSDGKIVRDYTVGSVDSPDGNGSREV